VWNGEVSTDPARLATGGAEVEQGQGELVVDQQVARLEVAVHDALLLEVDERVGQLDPPRHRERHRDAIRVRVEPFRERFAVDVVEDEVQLGPVPTVVVAALHPGMAERAGDRRLLAKPARRALVADDVALEDLQHDLAAVPGVFGGIGLREATCSEEAADPVAIDDVARLMVHPTCPTERTYGSIVNCSVIANGGSSSRSCGVLAAAPEN
jgi:hypothetical protein